MAILTKISRCFPKLAPRCCPLQRSLLVSAKVSDPAGGFASGSSLRLASPPRTLFHTSSRSKAPLLLPPLMVKGAYYATRFGISLSPFIYKSRVYQAYPRATRFGLAFLIGSTSLVIFLSLDRNPYTGRLRLLLLDKETAAFYEELELARKLDATTFSETLEKSWGECALKLLESLVQTSDLEFESGALKVQFTNSKEIELILSQRGVLFVSRGFLHFIKGDSLLLAAGISHLLAHLSCQHSFEESGKTAFFSICLDVVRSALYLTMGHLAFLSDLAGISINHLQTHTLDNPFQLQLEDEANTISLHLMARSGLNPNIVLSFLEKLQAASKEVSSRESAQAAQDPLAKKVGEAIKTMTSLNPPSDFHALHPSNEESIGKLHGALLPAMAVYNTPGQPLSRLLSDCPHLKDSLSRINDSLATRS